MALLVTLFLVLVNIFNSVTANSPKAEGELMQIFSPEKIYYFTRLDCSGDVGGILYYPRVRSVGRVRLDTEDDSEHEAERGGGEEEGAERSEETDRAGAEVWTMLE